jgi:hypothetical protein
MRVEELRTLYHAEPFEPFTLHLADGREIPVRHREFVALAPSGRTLTVYQPDDSFNVVDLMLVTALEVEADRKSDADASSGPSAT